MPAGPGRGRRPGCLRRHRARLPVTARRPQGDDDGAADDAGRRPARRTAALLPGPESVHRPGRDIGRSPAAGQCRRTTVTTACRVVPATTSTTTSLPAGVQESPAFVNARPGWGTRRGRRRRVPWSGAGTARRVRREAVRRGPSSAGRCR
jgi:hypothetical protein